MPTTQDVQTQQDIESILPPVVRQFGGYVSAFSHEHKTITMHYDVGSQYCHSEVIVQGGILTAMLDAAMAYVVVGVGGIRQQVATLELKMNFIAVANPGRFVALGRIVHQGRSTVFMEGELFQNDRLVATSSATGKLVTPKAW